MVPGALTLRFANLDPQTPEIEAEFDFDGWSARSTAYVDEDDFTSFVAALEAFSRTLAGEVTVEFGRDDGIGLLAMRWRSVGPSGRVACDLTLVTADRPGEARRVSLPLLTEPAALDRFIPGLRALFRTREPATLELRAEPA